MSTYFDTGILVICIIANTMLPVLSLAEDADQAPKIKVTWKPSFKDHYVILSVTNTGGTPIRIRSEIAAIVNSAGTDPQSLFASSQEAGIIYPALEFITKPGTIGYNMDFGGGVKQPPDTEEIKPGQTKDLKFPVGSFILKVANLLDEMDCVLNFNGKELGKVVMKKKDGVWKEE